MKTFYKPLLLSSFVLLTACDEKLTQSATNSASSSAQEIKALKAQIDAQQAELKTLKAELEKQQKAAKQTADNPPYLNAKSSILFKKDDEIKHTKPADHKEDEYWLEKSPISYHFSTVETQLPWLNNLLLEWVDPRNDKQGKPRLNKAETVKEIDRHYQADLQIVTAEKPIGWSLSVNTSYLGQINNIATFSIETDQYMGGAHNMYSSEFVVVDLDKQRKINFLDLFPKSEHAEMTNALWQIYVDHSKYQLDMEEPYTSRENFELSHNFYFSESGVELYYPPYALGPFAAGAIVLTFPWELALKHLTPEYKTMLQNAGYASYVTEEN